MVHHVGALLVALTVLFGRVHAPQALLLRALTPLLPGSPSASPYFPEHRRRLITSTISWALRLASSFAYQITVQLKCTSFSGSNCNFMSDAFPRSHWTCPKRELQRLLGELRITVLAIPDSTEYLSWI